MPKLSTKPYQRPRSSITLVPLTVINGKKHTRVGTAIISSSTVLCSEKDLDSKRNKVIDFWSDHIIGIIYTDKNGNDEVLSLTMYQDCPDFVLPVRFKRGIKYRGNELNLRTEPATTVHVSISQKDWDKLNA